MHALRDQTIEELASHGFAARLAPITMIDSIKDRIRGFKEQELLSQTFYNRYLSWANENYTDKIPGIKSVMMIAVPDKITKLHFRYKGKDHTAVIPPTYVYKGVDPLVESAMEAIFAPLNFHYKKANLYEKSLAVGTGLGYYGRNNIFYVPGMGSFVRLLAYYTDIPCEGYGEYKPVSMPECATCRACVNACPTGSISEQRFLINAERCLTYLNENEGVFPEWVEPGWHNAIIGCMRCQAVCPKNKDFLDEIGREVSFSEEETAMILDKTPWDAVPDTLRQKIDDLDMRYYYNVLERNLRVLIH